MSEEELRAELASRAKALQRRLANLTSVGASEKVMHGLGCVYHRWSCRCVVCGLRLIGAAVWLHRQP